MNGKWKAAVLHHEIRESFTEDDSRVNRKSKEMITPSHGYHLLCHCFIEEFGEVDESFSEFVQISMNLYSGLMFVHPVKKIVVLNHSLGGLGGLTNKLGLGVCTCGDLNRFFQTQSRVNGSFIGFVPLTLDIIMNIFDIYPLEDASSEEELEEEGEGEEERVSDIPPSNSQSNTENNNHPDFTGVNRSFRVSLSRQREITSNGVMACDGLIVVKLEGVFKCQSQNCDHIFVNGCCGSTLFDENDGNPCLEYCVCCIRGLSCSKSSCSSELTIDNIDYCEYCLRIFHDGCLSEEDGLTSYCDDCGINFKASDET